MEALALSSLTNALEAGDAGALLILLAIGIKAAFPGLHVWLKDGYAEATHSGPVWLCAFTTKCAVCMLARLFRGRCADHHRWHYGNVPYFLRGDRK